MASILLTSIIVFSVYSPIFSFWGYGTNITIISLSLSFLFLKFIIWRNLDIELTFFSPIFFALVFFLGWSAFGFFYSIDPDISMKSALRTFIGAALFLGLVLHIREKNQLIRFLWLALCCAGFMCFISFLQLLGFSIPLIPEIKDGIPTGYFGHKNILATYLLMHFPLAGYLFCHAPTRFKKKIAGILFVMIILTLLFSGSRGGQAVLVFQLTGILGYLIFKKDIKKINNLAAGGLIILVTYFSLNFLLYGVATSAQPSLLDAVTGENSAWTNMRSRLVFWQMGWEIFKDHWLTGTGPWTFELLFPIYLAKSTFGLKKELYHIIDPHIDPPHSHNLFIQIGTDAGIIGLGLILFFVIAFYFRGIALMRNTPLDVRELIFFLLLSVTGFMMHNQVEYSWIPTGIIYPFILCVFSVDFLDRKYGTRKNPATKSDSNVFAGVTVSFLIIGVITSMNYYKYQTLNYETVSPATDFSDLQTRMKEAKEICTSCGLPYIKMGEALLHQYRLNPQPEVLIKAEQELTEASRLTPFNPLHLIYMADVRSFQQRWEEVKKLYSQAFKYIRMRSLAMCRLFSHKIPDKCG